MVPIICQFISGCCWFSLCVSNLLLTRQNSVLPTLFSISRVSLFEWCVPTYFFKHFKSCPRPSTTHHHLPHYSLIIMDLTRHSIISQPNRVYTRSHSSLVLVSFSLTENNTKSYYSIDCCSGFRRVCPDCPIFFLFYIYLFLGNLFMIINWYCLH
jgi:hypothetical protein